MGRVGSGIRGLMVGAAMVCLVPVLALGGLSGSTPLIDPAPRNSQPPAFDGTRAAAPVLLVDGGDTPEAGAFYQQAMDDYFGPGGWDRYDLPEQGLPSPADLFLSVLAQYQGVVWHAGAAGLADLQEVAPVLADYLAGPNFGRLLLVCPDAINAMPGLSPTLLMDHLGVEYLSPNFAPLTLPTDAQALTLALDLPTLVCQGTTLRGTGLGPLEGSEALYRLEYCPRCYSTRPPYDPVVAVRTPARQVDALARAIFITLPLQDFSGAGAMLQTLMEYHLGFVSAAGTESGAGRARLAVSNDGSLGNFFAGADQPSLVYPYPGYVEHLHQGGIWVGARTPDGGLHVSTSADHFSTAAEGYELREFTPTEEPMVILSSDPANPAYDPAALAPWQLECSFRDDALLESGAHQTLGLKVNLRAMSWDAYPLDDGVALEYTVINESAGDLRDLYFGLFTDTTVGNVLQSPPYPVPPYDYAMWNYFDDVNGAWRPGDRPDDPDIWMMWEHDDDLDDGWSPSWVGSRLLASDPAAQPGYGVPPVSYNAMRFRDGPTTDDESWDEETQTNLPGRYQLMSNGDFDVGVVGEDDFTVASDWLGLLSTGPFPVLAAGDTLRVSFAILCAPDSWNLQRNSRRLAELAAAGWQLDVSVAPPPAGMDRLERAVPNPFNPVTSIAFSLERAGHARLEVYGLDGRLVRVLVDEGRPAGRQRVRWDGRDGGGAAAASGLYLYRLTTPTGRRLAGQMTLVR